MTSPSPIQDRTREFGRRIVSMFMWSLGVVDIAVGENVREGAQKLPVWDRWSLYVFVVGMLWIMVAVLIYEGGRRVLMDLLNGLREVRAAWRKL